MSASSVSTPDVLDLRGEGPRAIEAFDEEPDAADAPLPQAPGSPEPATLTYERYYGLRETAFSLSTDPRFLLSQRCAFPGPARPRRRDSPPRRPDHPDRRHRSGQDDAVPRGAVAAESKDVCGLVPDPFVTREDLLKTMLVDFGVMSVEDLVKGRLKGASRPDLSYPLYQFLQALAPLEAFAVLGDRRSAEPVAAAARGEEMRILSDLEAAGRKLLQVVLVGQPEFDEHLKLPRLRQIKQRVTVHCELGPLARDGVAGYVTHRLQVAGTTPDQLRLTDEALNMVHAASASVPRVMDLLWRPRGRDRAGYFFAHVAHRAGLVRARVDRPAAAAAGAGRSRGAGR